MQTIQLYVRYVLPLSIDYPGYGALGTRVSAAAVMTLLPHHAS